MNDKNTPVIIDAEYSLEESKGGFVVPKKRGDLSLPGGFTLKEKDQQTLKKIVTSVVKSVFYFLLWTVRQVGSIMIAGVSGTVDGIKGAAEQESRYDTKYDSKDKRAVTNKKRNERPIWDIPTREEEEADREMRYRYGRR